MVTQTITLDPSSSATGVAVAPNGSRVYVTNQVANTVSGTVSVIDTTLNLPAVTATITDLAQPFGVGVTPDGKHVYVALEGIPNVAPGPGVSVIDAATNTVVNTINTPGCSDLPCSGPVAFGLFIQPSPPPQFAGTPGSTNCNGASVSALSNEFGNNLGAAATALGFKSVKALQTAIGTFCAG